MITVLLAEDHKIVRDGIKSLLEDEPNIKIIAEAASGTQVLKLIEAGTNADIILSDMEMPEMSGLELVKQLKQLWPEKKVLILSMIDDPGRILEVIDAGAYGYLLKNISTEELTFAIRHVASGSKYVCAEIALRLLNLFSKNKTQKDIPKKQLETELSERETEVLMLLAEGLTNHEIAEKLFISKRTVEGYRQSLIQKTDSKNTASLIRFAFFNGLIR